MKSKSYLIEASCRHRRSPSWVIRGLKPSAEAQSGHQGLPVPETLGRPHLHPSTFTLQTSKQAQSGHQGLPVPETLGRPHHTLHTSNFQTSFTSGVCPFRNPRPTTFQLLPLQTSKQVQSGHQGFARSRNPRPTTLHPSTLHPSNFQTSSVRSSGVCPSPKPSADHISHFFKLHLPETRQTSKPSHSVRFIRGLPVHRNPPNKPTTSSPLQTSHFKPTSKPSLAVKQAQSVIRGLPVPETLGRPLFTLQTQSPFKLLTSSCLSPERTASRSGP